MRVISVAAVMIAILAAGQFLRPAPHATASPPDQADAAIDPYALQLTIDIKSLPEQETGDPI